MKADEQYSPDVALLMPRCRPFYLPREFISVHIVAVYIPTDAKSKNPMQELTAAAATGPSYEAAEKGSIGILFLHFKNNSKFSLIH